MLSACWLEEKPSCTNKQVVRRQRNTRTGEGNTTIDWFQEQQNVQRLPMGSWTCIVTVRKYFRSELPKVSEVNYLYSHSWWWARPSLTMNMRAQTEIRITHLTVEKKIIIWLPLQQVWLILEACANVDQIATVAEVDIHYRGDPGLRRRLHERRWLWSHPMAPHRGSVEGIADATARGRRRGRSSTRELGRDGRAGWGCGDCKEGGREGCHEIAWEADGRLCQCGPMFISFFFFYSIQICYTNLKIPTHPMF